MVTQNNLNAYSQNNKNLLREGLDSIRKGILKDLYIYIIATILIATPLISGIYYSYVHTITIITSPPTPPIDYIFYFLMAVFVFLSIYSVIDLYKGFKALSNVDKKMDIGISFSLFFIAGSISFLILYTMDTAASTSPVITSGVPYHDYYLPLSFALILSSMVLLSETFNIFDKYLNKTMRKRVYTYLILMIAMYIFATIFNQVFSLEELFPVLILIFLLLLYRRIDANLKEIKYGQKSLQ